jgi:hypothetical protein
MMSNPDQRKQQMLEPVAAALPHEVMVDHRQVQQHEPGQRAEIDDARKIIDAVGEQQADQQRDAGNRQRAHVGRLEARMHLGQHRPAACRRAPWQTESATPPPARPWHSRWPMANTTATMVTSRSQAPPARSAMS